MELLVNRSNVYVRFIKCREPLETTRSLVGFGTVPAPIDASEIEAIQTVLLSGIPAEPHSFLREGEKVRVTRGPLEGVEGLLVKKRSEWRMIVSVTLLQRSIAVEIDRD